MQYRVAGGFWIDPEGNKHEVKNHAPFAADILRTEMIGDFQQQKLQPSTSGEGAEVRQDLKGLSGEEAAKLADERIGDTNSPQHNNTLKERGWVQGRVEDGRAEFSLLSEDAMNKAWAHMNQALDDLGSVFINGNEFTKEQLVGTAEASIAKVLSKISSKSNEGLGAWSGIKSKRVRYFR